MTTETLSDILIGGYHDQCEEWDADGLSPEEVRERYGTDAERAYVNWTYLFLK